MKILTSAASWSWILILFPAACADHGYHAPSSGYEAPSSGYEAPSSGYGAPHYEEVTQNHFHYYGLVPEYGAPKPSYSAPPPSYGYPAPNPEPYGSYAPGLGYGGGIFSEDPYLHLNKRELLGGALLLGAGVAKGIVLTGLFNRLSPNIQIGRKK